MQLNETIVRNVVQQVLAEMGRSSGNGRASARPAASSSSDGVFTDVAAAVSAARAAFEALTAGGVEARRKAIDCIRRISIEQSVELGTMEMNETKIGRLPHKIEKLKTLGEKTPGVDFMKSEVFTGDHGIAVIEHAPFGVIGAITPVTHSLPTITGNAVNMIASGNTVVVNPHPSGKLVAVEGVRRFNRAIREATGISNLICIIAEPTLETANALFAHRDIAMICVTGGPAVARAALNSGKRAVVAGPGNPPVVVDETADLARAARSIIQGASYDNNLLCIAEKEVFVVSSVADALMKEFEKAGAVRLSASEVDRLTAQAIQTVDAGNGRTKQVAHKDLIGKDAAVLAQAAGRSIAPQTELVFGETDEHNPFVAVEQMMPFVPIVRCRNVDEAIDKAKHYEHGYRHTAMIHSRNVENMTRMARALDTTLFVKNGPCMASLGLGGEGYISFSIATPTGEGVTTPLTFTRERRCSLIDDLRIIGTP